MKAHDPVGFDWIVDTNLLLLVGPDNDKMAKFLSEEIYPFMCELIHWVKEEGLLVENSEVHFQLLAKFRERNKC